MLKKWIDKTKSFMMAGPPPKFVALDIEGRKLRIVFAEPQRGLPVFRTLASVEAPADLDLKSAKVMGQFIGGVLKQLGLPTTRVLMDVPRGQTVLKTLTLPPIEHEREMPAMVRYQVEKELPFPLDEAVIDFTVDHHHAPSPSDGDPGAEKKSETVNVLVAAVQNSVVEHHEQIAAAGGFKLHRLGLRPYADMRCLGACLPEAERGQTILLVHVLPGEVEVNLLIEESLAFSRSGAVRQHDEGRPFSDKEMLEWLVVEVARSAQGALSAHRGRKIDRVFIAGDTGHEKAIVELIGERFRTACSLLDPVAALKIKVEGESGLGFITPLGLAIAHGTAERMPFDFLNPKNPPVERNIAKIRNIAAAASIGVLLVGGLVYGIVNRNIASSELAELRDKYNDLEKKNRPIEKLSKRVDAISEWKNESHNWLDHWANISAHFPPATEAYITTLKTNADGSFVFNVKATASKVITDLSKSLREAGYDVKLGAETVQNDDFGYRYNSSFRLGVEAKQKVEIANLSVKQRPLDDGSSEILRRKGRYIPTAVPSPAPSNGSGEGYEGGGEESKTGADSGNGDTTATGAAAEAGVEKPAENTGDSRASSGGTSERLREKGGGPAATSEKSTGDNRERTDDKGKPSKGYEKNRDERTREERPREERKDRR